MNLSKPKLLFAVLLLVTTSLFAAEPASFPVERIEVAGGGSRIQSIVVAQSLLREGQTYSEGELADAISRIRRLPFVRAVSFSLAKGSERGLYRLVITVDPMESLFFDAQLRSVRRDHQFSSDSNYAGLTLGGRLPVGSTGMAHASVTVFDSFNDDGVDTVRHPQFTVGYSLYRIGSRAVFADLSVSAQQRPEINPFNTPVRNGTDTAVHAVVGVPIHGSQSIRAEWNRYRFPFSADVDGEHVSAEAGNDNVELFWLLDTTDDPIYPLHGSFVKAGVVGGRGQSAFFGFDANGPITGENTYDNYGAEASASHYWSLSNDRALSLHGSYDDIRTDFDQPVLGSGFDSQRFILGAGFTKRFGGPNTDAWFDVRVNGTRYNWSDRNDEFGARAEFAHRSKWGIARIGVEYQGSRN